MSRAEQGGQSYLLDSENVATMGQLLFQDQLMTEATGGLFPRRSATEIAAMRRVLDLGCGPGAWIFSVARQYPHIEAVGLDNNLSMVSYAQTQAARDRLPNARFEFGNALEKLPFPDATFDMINIRFASPWVPREAWLHLLQRCRRLMRPGGFIRWTEGDRFAQTTSAAFEEFFRLLAMLHHRDGLGFSCDGLTLGMTPMLGQLLTDASYQHIQSQPCVIDISYGSPLHASQVRMFTGFFKYHRDRMVEMELFSQEKAEQLYQALITDMQSKTFRGLTYLLTVEGEAV